MGVHRTIPPLAAAAALSLTLAGPASALEIKSSDVHAMGYPTTEAIAYMGELLDKWTNGRIATQIFHSMQLGGEKEALEQVQVGALEMTRVSVGVVGPIVDEFNAFNLPYLFESVAHLHDVVDGAENNPPSYVTQNHVEVAKYYTLDEHLIVPEIFVLSKQVWDTLSPVETERELWAEMEQAIELREIPMEHGRLIMTPDEVLKRCDQNTIGVVPTLGVTFTCQYEPVKAVSDALDRLQRQQGLDIPIHVDGASGGFLAPFCTPDLLWDFRLPRVTSINTSGHKFGLSPLGVGWVLWREAQDLPPDLIFNVNYLGGNMPTFALNFSRPGGQIVSQYYNFLRLGKEGYRKIHTACYQTAQYLAAEIGKMGPFEIIYDGDMSSGIPALCWKIKDGFDTRGYTLYDLADRLRARGWQVPVYSMPANRQDLVIQRVLVRHGVSRDLAALLIEDMRRSIEYFGKRPISRPMGGDEASGFHH